VLEHGFCFGSNTIIDPRKRSIDGVRAARKESAPSPRSCIRRNAVCTSDADRAVVSNCFGTTDSHADKVASATTRWYTLTCLKDQ